MSPLQAILNQNARSMSPLPAAALFVTTVYSTNPRHDWALRHPQQITARVYSPLWEVRAEALVGSTWYSKNYRRRGQYSRRSWSRDWYLILNNLNQRQDQYSITSDWRLANRSIEQLEDNIPKYSGDLRRDQFLFLNDAASGSADQIYPILKGSETRSIFNTGFEMWCDAGASSWRWNLNKPLETQARTQPET